MIEAAGAPGADGRSGPRGADVGAPPPAAVETVCLVKDFGFRRILDGVSLDVPRGRFLTLFGPNGAGKTTLLRILTTVSRPTSGSVRIAGINARGPDASAVRSKIGFISHQSLLYDGLSALENLLFFGRLYGVAGVKERSERLLNDVRLWERRNDRAGTFSRGMTQRLAIARALVHDPEILILDEPFTGLDPAASRLLMELLGSLRAGGRSAIITTHDLDLGLALSDRWAILVNGRLSASGASAATTLEGLTMRYFEAASGRPSGGTRA